MEPTRPTSGRSRATCAAAAEWYHCALPFRFCCHDTKSPQKDAYPIELRVTVNGIRLIIEVCGQDSKVVVTDVSLLTCCHSPPPPSYLA